MTKKTDFVHLHVHSENSLLDGLESPINLIKKAKELDMKSLALTDHGTMRGLLNFYFSAKKNNINPILGQEFYFHPDRKSKDQDHRFNHTTILIKNEIGWKNCINLTTEANMTGFYYKPRIDIDLLEKHKEGLIMGSGCMASITNQHIMKGEDKEAKWWFDKFLEIFGDDFYIELTTTEDNWQKYLNTWLVRYAKENGILYTIGSDVHFVDKDSYYDHDVLYCVQFKSKYSDPVWEGEGKKPKGFRTKSPVKETWLKSQEEMWEYWHHHCQPMADPYGSLGSLYIEEGDFFQAMSNTSVVANKCGDISLEDMYSKYRMPDMSMESPKSELMSRCISNTYRKNYISQKKNDEQGEYIKRLNREIELICNQGFASYFMMTADLTD